MDELTEFNFSSCKRLDRSNSLSLHMRFDIFSPRCIGVIFIVTLSIERYVRFSIVDRESHTAINTTPQRIQFNSNEMDTCLFTYSAVLIVSCPPACMHA